MKAKLNRSISVESLTKKLISSMTCH